MEDKTQSLSKEVAKTSGRRGFLATLVQGAVGLGFLTSSLLVGRDTVMAAPLPTPIPATPAPTATPKPCYPVGATNTYQCTANGCTNGDSKGCIFGLPPKYCATCSGQQGPAACNGATPNAGGYWTCCCNGKLMQCVDCGKNPPSGGSFTIECICSVDTGQQCTATPTPTPTPTATPTPTPTPQPTTLPTAMPTAVPDNPVGD